MVAAIAHAGRQVQWEQALEMLASMQESSSNVQPDTTTYNAAITKFAYYLLRRQFTENPGLTVITRREASVFRPTRIIPAGV